MQENWQKNYKPMIELLLQQENGHFAALILVCSCMEHTYRVIEDVPSECQIGVAGKSFRFIVETWAESGGLKKGELFDFQKRFIADVAATLIMSDVFQKLKHEGYLPAITAKRLSECYGNDDNGEDIITLYLSNEPDASYIEKNTVDIEGEGYDKRVVEGSYRTTVNAAWYCNCFIEGIDAAYKRALSTQDKLVNR